MDDSEDIPCEIIKEKGDGIFLRKYEDGEPIEAWFPSSQIVFKRRNNKTGKVIANIPDWLLDKKGW